MQPARSAAQEWREHWKVALAAAIGISIPALHLYSLGVFIAPIEQEFGWSRAEISAGVLIYSIIAVLLTPVAGMACDRFGARRVGIPGVIAYCCALGALSLTSESIWSWLALWTILSLAQVFVSATVWVSGVVGFFHKGRGFALAVCLSGTGITVTLVPTVANLLIANFGWRSAYIGLAMIWMGFTLPFLLGFFTSAKDKARARGEKASAAPAIPGATLREGMSLTFVKIALGTFLISAAALPLSVNAVPILQDVGLAREAAVAMASAAGIGSIAGRLSVGLLLDRFSSSIVAAGCVSMPILSVLLLLFLPDYPLAALAAIFIVGLAVGAELDIGAYLISQHFGLKAFGAMFGLIAGVVTLTAGAGPAIVNFLYDRVGSYQPFLWASIPICALASLAFLSLSRVPYRVEAGPGQAQNL